MENNLPGIVSIKKVLCQDLPKNLIKKYIAKFPIAILCDSTPIKFFGTPECEAVTKRDGNSKVEEAKLEFFTLVDYDFSAHECGFIIEDCSCQKWLIGTYEQPFPVISVVRNSGIVGGSPAGYKWSISLSSFKSLIPLVG